MLSCVIVLIGTYEYWQFFCALNTHAYQQVFIGYSNHFLALLKRKRRGTFCRLSVSVLCLDSNIFPKVYLNATIYRKIIVINIQEVIQ